MLYVYSYVRNNKRLGRQQGRRFIYALRSAYFDVDVSMYDTMILCTIYNKSCTTFTRAYYFFYKLTITTNNILYNFTLLLKV